MLPLQNCSLRGECKCVYKHYKDRRSEPRRDADIGLPSMRTLHADKRLGIGRRITDAA